MVDMKNDIFFVREEKLPKIARRKHATRCGYLPVIILKDLPFGKKKVGVYWYDLHFIGNPECHLCDTVVEGEDLVELSYERLRDEIVDEYSILDLLRYEYGIYVRLTDAGLHKLCEPIPKDGDVMHYGYYLCKDCLGTYCDNFLEKTLLFTEDYKFPDSPSLKHRIETITRLVRENDIQRLR